MASIINYNNEKAASTSETAANTLKDLVVTSLEENKAEDIVILDLAGKANFARYLVIATGRSSRHAIGVADNLVDRIIEAGYKDISIEGKGQGDWILVDAHEVVTHIFRAEVRDLYQLEKIWGFDIDLEKE